MATRLDPQLQEWVTARRRFRLSHAHVQMGRELGLNPAKLGKIANHRQEPWKAPLPEYIEYLYVKRFRRPRPERVLSIEQVAEARERKKAEKRAERRQRRQERDAEELAAPPGVALDTAATGDADGTERS